MAAVGANRRRQKIVWQALGQPLDEAAGDGWRAGAIPNARRIADGNQCSENAPRGRRPLDQAFVNMVAERRCVVAPCEKSKSDRNRHEDLSSVVLVRIRILCFIFVLVPAFLDLSFEGHAGNDHLLLALFNGRVEVLFQLLERR